MIFPGGGDGLGARAKKKRKCVRGVCSPIDLAMRIEDRKTEYEGTSGTKFLFEIPGTVYERLQFFFAILFLLT